jgi:hypothetical protein
MGEIIQTVLLERCSLIDLGNGLRLVSYYGEKKEIPEVDQEKNPTEE